MRSASSFPKPSCCISALVQKQEEARQLREQLTGCGNHRHQEEREELLAGHVCCFVWKREAVSVVCSCKDLRFGILC